MGYQAIGPDKKAINITLTERLNGGGEGYVYDTNLPGYVAKLYKKGHATENKYRKCDWFVSKQIRHSGICLPTHLLADEDDNFIGYLMPKAKGQTLASVIHPMELRENYPHLTRIHLARLCMSLLDQINFLHENGILVCDLDMTNILVDDLDGNNPKTFIIDCDSFQIGAGASMMFPGDVGRPLATSKELQDVPFDEQARTVSNEYFSITVLLFKILVPNQNPYMTKGGKNDEAQLVREGVFPYTADPTKIRKVANKIPGEWAVEVWSYLPAYITELFWKNLHKDGDHYSPGKRTNIKEWLTVIEQYHNELCSLSSDANRVKIFPSSGKQKKTDPKTLNNADAEKFQLQYKAKVFNEVSKSVDVGFPAASLFMAGFLIVFAYMFDPFSIITRTTLNALPGFIADYIWVIALIPLAVFFVFLVGIIVVTFEDRRSRHYDKLADKAKRKDVLKNGRIERVYKKNTPSASQLLQREKIVGNLLCIAALLPFCIAAYLACGAITSNDGWNDYAGSKLETAYADGNTAALNSLTDGLYGNETDFVQASAGSYVYRAGSGGSDGREWHGDQIELAPNEPFTVRVLIRNDNKDVQISAKNVRVFRDSKWESGSKQDMTVTYTITYDNGTGETQTISDSVKIHFTDKVNSYRYPYSREYLRNQTFTLGESRIDGDALNDDEGVLVGMTGTDGEIPGGENGYCLIYEDEQENSDTASLFSDGWSYYDDPSSEKTYAFFGSDDAYLNVMNNSSYGDETDFVQAIALENENTNPTLGDNSLWHGDVLEIDPSTPYMVRVFLRNDHESSDSKITDVRISRDNKWENGYTDEITTYVVSYKNADGNTRVMEDSVRIHFTEKVDTSSRYYRCSLRSAYLGKGDALVWGDDSVGSYKALSSTQGMLVGEKGFDGIISGGKNGYCLLYQYSHEDTERE